MLLLKQLPFSLHFRMDKKPANYSHHPMIFIIFDHMKEWSHANRENNRRNTDTNPSYVDTKGLEDDVDFAEQSKEEILQVLQQAVEEMNLVKQGKLRARDAKDLLNEL